MKRLLTILLLTIALLPVTVMAARLPYDAKRPQGITADPEPDLDGIVEVSFKIDNLGKVQILHINSTSPQLADYVIKKLGKIQLEEGNSEIGKVIRYRFVFKKQA